MLLLQGIRKLPCSSAFFTGIQPVFLCLLCPTEMLMGRDLLSDRSWLQLICLLHLLASVYYSMSVVLAQ